MYAELSLNKQHIKKCFHVSENYDEDAKRKKALEAERERVALVFEKKCKNKKIENKQHVEVKKIKKRKEKGSESLKKGK